MKHRKRPFCHRHRGDLKFRMVEICTLLCIGWKSIDIAKRVGVTNSQMRIFIRSPEFSLRFNEIERDITDSTIRTAKYVMNLSLKRLAKLIAHTNPSVALRAIELAFSINSKPALRESPRMGKFLEDAGFVPKSPGEFQEAERFSDKAYKAASEFLKETNGLNGKVSGEDKPN